MSTNPDAIWTQLCEGLSEPWLEEIRGLPIDGDDVEATLDIWSIALTSELKKPDRKQAASTVLRRLARINGDLDEG